MTDEMDAVSAYPDPVAAKIAATSTYGQRRMPDVIDFCWKCVWAIIENKLPVFQEDYLPMKDQWVGGSSRTGTLSLHDIEAFYRGHTRWKVQGWDLAQTLPMVAVTTVDNCRVCPIHISRRMGA